MHPTPEQNKSGFVLVPCWLLEGNRELKPSDLLLIARVRGWEVAGRTCYESNAALAKLIHATPRTVSSAVNRLEKLGFLSIRSQTIKGRTERTLSLGHQLAGCRNTDPKPYIVIPDWLTHSHPELNAAELLVLSWAIGYSQQGATFEAKYPTISKAIRKSETRTQRLIAALVKDGYLIRNTPTGTGTHRAKHHQLIPGERLTSASNVLCYFTGVEKNDSKGRKKRQPGVSKISTNKLPNTNTNKINSECQLHNWRNEVITSELQHAEQLLNAAVSWQQQSNLPNLSIQPGLSESLFYNLQRAADEVFCSDLEGIDPDDFANALDSRYHARRVNKRSQPVNLVWLLGVGGEDLAYSSGFLLSVHEEMELLWQP